MKKIAAIALVIAMTVLGTASCSKSKTSSKKTTTTCVTKNH